MVAYIRRSGYFFTTAFALSLLFAILAVGLSAKVWFLTTASSAPEPVDNGSEESEDIDWLMDVLRRDPFGKLETASSDTASHAQNFDHSTEESDHEEGRVYTIDKSPSKQHKEYHVHYHTHQHLVSRDRKYVDMPSNVKYSLHKPVSNGFRPHLAGFKDFETLLKKKSEPKLYEYAPSERYKRYRPQQLGILNSPGGSPKARENVGNLIARESKNITRMISKNYGSLKLPLQENYPSLDRKPFVKLQNLRKVGNMSGWLVYSWS